MARINTAETGMCGEDISCAFLKLKGYEILHRNYRAGRYELDIVAKDGDEVVFVEVKLRRSDDYGGALGAVPRKKRLDLARAAAWYLSERSPAAASYRFDVIAISIDRGSAGMRLSHIERAFQCDGGGHF